MKKLGLMLLATVLALTLAMPALADTGSVTLSEAGKNDLSYEAALILAREAWSQRVGVTDREDGDRFVTACFTVMETQAGRQRAWHIVLRDDSKVQSQSHDAVVLSPSGLVAYVDTYRQSDRLKEWEMARGPFAFWSHKDRELFYNLYQKTPGDTAFFAQPKADLMSEEQAVQLAAETIAKRMLATSEPLSTYRLSATFLMPGDFGSDDLYATPFWAIAYYMQKPDSPTEWTIAYQVNISAVNGSILFDYNYFSDGPSNG